MAVVNYDKISASVFWNFLLKQKLQLSQLYVYKLQAKKFFQKNELFHLGF